MTEGPVFSTLIKFTIPLILGNFLQLTYNAVDSMIVGRFAGSKALAAVGTSNPLMTLVLLFTNGICLGAGILVSYHYGAKEFDILKRQVSTALLSGLAFSAFCAVVFIVFAPQILSLLQVDPKIMSDSISYLRTIMAGLVFSFLYNYFASILRAMGDSRSPLYFLGISAGLNIIGDLFLVVSLNMGIFGAALSTVICEGLSAVLCWIYIYLKVPELRLGREWLVFDRSQLKKTLSYGIVSALQQSTVQIGKLAVQGAVNTLGVTYTAAFNATNRFDDYAIVPEQNMAHAMTSVMAQDIGAGKMERSNRTFYIGMVMEIVFGTFMGVILYTFSNPIMQLFTKDPEVIAAGERYLHVIAFMYPLPGLTNGLQGYFRGIGDLKVTLWSSMINMGVRVIACFIMVFHYSMGFISVPWSYFIGWIAMIAFELPFLVDYMHHHTHAF